MLDIKKILKDKNASIEQLNKRGSDFAPVIEELLVNYNKFLALTEDEKVIREELNKISKTIATDPSEDNKQKASKVSKDAKEVSQKAKDAYEEYRLVALTLPNFPSDSTPIGADETENVVIADFGEIKNKKSKPHWEIIDEKNLTHSKEEKEISGARQVMYGDKLSQLVWAIEMFMLDEHKKDGYDQVEPPLIVNAKALENTGQLPKFEEDLYSVGNGQYLIPTAEVPLTNLAFKKIFKESELPTKIVGATSCFRKEAGSAGRDTRGLIRLHQFRKVELVNFGIPSQDSKTFSEMLTQASKILDKLEIPYRHLELCTGDLGFASQRTVDIEVFMPGIDKYLEISSVSSVSDFQARRMNAKFINEDGNKDLIFTYNGSALAIERTVAAILENYYDETSNEVKIPEVLQKYLTFNVI